MPRARSPRVDPPLTEQPIDVGDLMFKARLCGEGFRSIAHRYGVSVREVEQSVEDRCTAITPDARQRALRIELERVEELYSVFFKLAIAERSEAAAAICCRLSERRAALWGLDCYAPQNPVMIIEATRAPSSVDKIMAALNRLAGKSSGSDLLEEPSPSVDDDTVH